jgi:hypothetical protein
MKSEILVVFQWEFVVLVVAVAMVLVVASDGFKVAEWFEFVCGKKILRLF